MALKSKAKSEFQDRILDIRRVTRVVAGGKRFSFRATVAVGDLKGRVGVANAKGLDVIVAVEKAKKQALKNLIKVPLKENRTIFYEVEAKYSAARVRLKPAKKGHGLIAGGGTRAVLELAGIKDVTAKQLGRTTNKLTNAMAALLALKKLAHLTQQEEKNNNEQESGQSTK